MTCMTWCPYCREVTLCNRVRENYSERLVCTRCNRTAGWYYGQDDEEEPTDTEAPHDPRQTP